MSGEIPCRLPAAAIVLAAARDAMGIDWMIKREINESIPPAYTKHIGRESVAVFGRPA